MAQGQAKPNYPDPTAKPQTLNPGRSRLQQWLRARAVGGAGAASRQLLQGRGAAAVWGGAPVRLAALMQEAGELITSKLTTYGHPLTPQLQMTTSYTYDL